MSDRSAIEWTQATWNPTTGCDRVSAGCDHCYALTLAGRLKAMGSPKYQADGNPRTSGPGFGVVAHPDVLDVPLSWRTPRRVFVNSMSDLFHQAVPDEFIVEVFARMWWAPDHTFQVLTKRHRRLRSLMPKIEACLRGRERDLALVDCPTPLTWPLPNVWLGVSAEDQQRAELRLPALAETPTVVRWVSAEPLLGPVDLTPWLPALHWVVAGGESGPDARPMHPGWARSLRDQTLQAGVPFFFKQWGHWVPEAQNTAALTRASAGRALYIDTDGATRPARYGSRAGAVTVQPVGKHRAGRQLDGRTWNQMPDRPATAGVPRPRPTTGR